MPHGQTTCRSYYEHNTHFKTLCHLQRPTLICLYLQISLRFPPRNKKHKMLPSSIRQSHGLSSSVLFDCIQSPDHNSFYHLRHTDKPLQSYCPASLLSHPLEPARSECGTLFPIHLLSSMYRATCTRSAMSHSISNCIICTFLLKYKVFKTDSNVFYPFGFRCHMFFSQVYIL